MISKKHQKVCRVLNFTDHFLILASVITGCVSISAFASLVGVAIGITISAIGLKIFSITAGIKKNDNFNNFNNSIIKRKNRKRNMIK